MKPVHPAGLLFTGGSSSRMGVDKWSLSIGGQTLAQRAAAVLEHAAYPVLVVGPEADTGLFAVEDPGEGPLGALAAGMGALAVRAHDGPALVLACDMPLVPAGLLRHLAESLGDADAVVPTVAGRDQPMCGCYTPHAASVAARLFREGSRALHDLMDAIEVVRLPEADWDHIAPPEALADVDTPAEFEAARRLLER